MVIERPDGIRVACDLIDVAAGGLALRCVEEVEAGIAVRIGLAATEVVVRPTARELLATEPDWLGHGIVLGADVRHEDAAFRVRVRFEDPDVPELRAFVEKVSRQALSWSAGL